MPSGGNFTSCNCGPDAEPCASPTEPVATVGLCLADGSPIAVTVIRDCAGTVTSEGWIDLTSGAYSAGPPPAGAGACGDSRSIQVSGTFCDVDPATGDVLGLVLIEYQYAADGSIDGVRLVDAVTGATYTPAGEVTTCPSEMDQPEQDLVRLCDTDPATGEATAFLRDYRRDETGAVVGHTDYTLDGQPYTPAGTVGACGPALVPCEDGDGSTPASSGPITGGSEVPADVAQGAPLPAGQSHEAPGMGALLTGGTWTMPPTNCGVSGSNFDHGYGAVQLPAVPRPACDAGTVTVTVKFHWRQDGPDAGQATTGDARLLVHDGAGTVTQAAAEVNPQSTPVGAEGDYELTATIDAARLAAGDVYVMVNAETWQDSWNVSPTCKGWTYSAWSAEYAYDVTGCPDAPPPPLAQLVKVCTAEPIPVTTEAGKDTEIAVLCDIAADGTSTPFLRAYQIDAVTGIVGVVADTELDGVTPYNPLGEIGVCGAPEEEPEPCRDTSTLLLCDLPADGDHDGAPTATDDTATLTYSPGGGHATLPGGAPALWAGSPFTIPADADGSAGSGDQVYRMVSARLTPPAAIPDCNDGTVNITAALDITNDGPGPGGGYTGKLMLLVGGSPVDEDALLTSSPVGVTQHRTVTADVTLADFEAGAVEVVLAAETWQAQPKSWTAENFTATYVVGEPAGGCATQYLRTIVTDCETGQVISSTTTTLDGQPYTVVGDPGQCAPTGGSGECCEPPEQADLIDCDDGRALLVKTCSTDESPGEPEPCRDTATVLLCDDGGQPEQTSRITSSEYPSGGGVLPNGVEWTVTPAQRALDDGITQAWTFSEPARVRVGVVSVNCPQECVVLPEGAIPERLDEFHQWDPGTRQLCPLEGASGQAQSVFQLEGEPTGFQVTGVGAPECLRAVVWMDLTVGVPPTQFLRKIVTDCETGAAISVTDTTLDGQPYTVVGEVGQCAPTGGGGECCEPPEHADLVDCDDGAGRAMLVKICDTAGEESPGEPTADAEPVELCDTQPDGTVVGFLRHITYDPAGAPVSYTDTAPDLAPYTPTGSVGACQPEPEPCQAQSVIEACRCDDTDGDGVADTDYVELLGIDCDGAVTSLSTWTPDLSAPYTPVSPVECDTAGAETPVTVQAHRVQLDPGGTWDAGTVPTLQSVTLSAHNGTGTITTADGTSTLFDGETVTWSVARDEDALLTGPLSVAVDSGVVTVTYTQSASA